MNRNRVYREVSVLGPDGLVKIPSTGALVGGTASETSDLGVYDESVVPLIFRFQFTETNAGIAPNDVIRYNGVDYKVQTVDNSPFHIEIAATSRRQVTRR